MTAMSTTAFTKATWATDANFRADGTIINGFFAGTGSLVQTTDTGQINWTTVTHATVANTAAGYEIWKFNDTLQATAPVFLKVEYGCAGSTGLGALWITIGTGSDGAGNLSGIFQARTQFTPSNTGMGTQTGQERGWANGGDSACVMALAVPSAASTAGAWLIGFERTRDWDGTPTADGLMYFFVNPSPFSTFPTTLSATQRFYATTVGTLNNTTTSIFGVSSPALSTASLASGADIYFYPVGHANTGFKVHGPSKYWAGCCFADFASGNTVALTVYGTSYNFFSMSNTVRNNTNQTLLIRTS